MAELVPDYEHYQADIIRMLCGDGMSYGQVANVIGYSSHTIRAWVKRPEYVVAIQQCYEAMQEEALRYAITVKSKRLTYLQDLMDKHWSLIAQRAATYSSVPSGGDTGLLVRQIKTVGTGQNAYDVAEYVYDSAVVKEIREISKQAAVEVGQWNDKSSVEVNISEKITVIRFEKQDDRSDEIIEGEYRNA